MAIFTWKNGEVPHSMEIKQVYGLIFSKDGRLLLLSSNENGITKYSLSGGKPEESDKEMSETLRRELLEELNVSISDPIMIGYQEVTENNGSAPFAQARMTAILEDVGEIRPDSDNGKIYNRLLVSPYKAIELLNWGEVGKLQINTAIETVKNVFGIVNFGDSTELI